MSNSSSPVALCSTCHQLFEIDDLSECLHCGGFTCIKDAPMCCSEQVLASVAYRLLEAEA